MTNSNDIIPPPPPYDDIQGLLINGYRGFNFIRFLVFTIPPANVAAVRKFCGALIPGTAGSPLTITAATRLSDTNTLPSYKLNLGLTQTGLQKLITPDNYNEVLNFCSEFFGTFDGGAAAAAGTVGDTGTSAPQNWWQGASWKLPEPYAANTPDLDLLISLYAASPEDRDALHEQLKKMMGDDSAVLAFQQDSDPLDPVGQQIHFGYRDGISQPRINGFSEADPELDDRPEVDSWHFIINLLAGTSSDTQNYTAHPLLTNGSFGAFRVLSQDVAGFEAFINQNGKEQAELLAAKMCGRWRDGTPIEVSPAKPANTHLLGQSLSNEYQLNNFNYINPSTHQEPNPPPLKNPDFGQACPYAAHVRRANPRDDPSVFGNTDARGNTIFASQNRVLRRARPYGPPYSPISELANQDRGLIGLFIGADIGAQFEFIMQQWITGNEFSKKDNSPNSSGYDPLFGSPDGITDFSYCKEGQDPENPNPGNSENYETLADLPQFITTKGGLYVFLPSISALKYLAAGTIPNNPFKRKR